MLNYQEVVSLIGAVGASTTVLVQGEKGIGKSSTIHSIQAEHFPDHHKIVVDCTTLSEGDLGLPWKVTINDKDVTSIVPTEMLGLHLEQPSVICLDELTKCSSQSVMNSLLPIITERRFGTHKLHPETVVYGTGNLVTELLHDTLPEHVLNRIMLVQQRKPKLVDEQGNPTEWLADYAIPRGIAPSMLVFCREFPQIFADYTPETQNNPYICKPGKMQDQFVTPRSFTNFCFNLLPKRKYITDKVFYEAMVGLVGKAAATQINVFLKTEADLPATATIVADPAGTPLPKSPVQQLMLIYRLAYGAGPQLIDATIHYVKRFNGEMQALFTHIVTSTPGLLCLMPKVRTAGMIRDAASLRQA